MGRRRELGRDHAARWRPIGPGRGARRTVLVEAEDGAEAQVLWRHLQEAGYDVLWCPGPTAGRQPCPLVTRQACPLVEEADLIVATGPRIPENRDVLDAQRRLHPGVPVIVAASGHAVRAAPGAFEGHRVICRHSSARALLDAVDDELGPATASPEAPPTRRPSPPPAC